MSLDPRDDRRRGRSKSPGRREERERSRSRVDEYTSRVETARAPSPPKSYDDAPRGYEDPRGYGGGGGYEDRPAVVTAEPRGDPRDPRSSYGSMNQYRDRDSSPPRGGAGSGGGYSMPGAYKTTVEEERETKRYEGGGGRGREKEYYPDKGYGSGGKDYGAPVAPPSKYEVDARKYIPPGGEYDARRYEERDGGRERGASFNAQIGHHSIAAQAGISHGGPQYPPGGYPTQMPYPEPQGPGRQYADPAKWEYAKPEETITYSKRTETSYNAAGGYGRPASPPRQDYRHGSHSSVSIPSGSRSRHGSEQQYITDPARTSQSKIVTVEPGSRRRDPSPNPASLGPRMHSLSVSTGHHGGAALSLATAPGSPLLEAYHGTYQSISPMPSPLMIASHPHSDINMIEPLSPSSSDDDRRSGKKSRRTARFHDPEEEATILAKALKGEKRAPDTAPLIEILPGLTHEQILDLRVEYKKIVKTGSEKKGVNIAKHIKLRLKEEDPSLMKACYACALGKWESEAYWANFWYQGEKSRRELLIESLMGRTNREIREIKDGFSDKKYSDSLTKCMKTELKEDKFKKAVLLVLEERKMEERSGHGLDRALVEDDVRDLYKAVRSEKGGESAMISIVVVRSDAHLREVLRSYEANYRANFAREMLKKSGNLVGELLAHILNGVINKPVRDALLVHHALSLSKSDSIRTELLISRLVRYHWDRPHMEAVKREYRGRYGVDMQAAVREGTKGEWGLFCEALCVRRMGDEVREVARVGGGGYDRR
ncbi:putative Annexin A1 [Rhexocercosporidium sp. MPI-PUGE-AT-0058]|nr:putative Annexin A1 [Rhexocercosporidium sp. MPI-PUGE-AT-0058]